MSRSGKDFGVAIQDAEELIQCFDDLNGGEVEAPEVLKRAALIMTLTAWETYVEDRVEEELTRSLQLLKGSHIGEYMFKRLNETLKAFHTPSGRKAQKLFLDFTGVDVTDQWTWNNMPESNDVFKALDFWIKKRGEAVHRSALDKQGGHLVTKPDVIKCINFFKELVHATERSFELADEGVIA